MPEGTTFICINNSTQVETPWDHAAVIPLRKEIRSVSISTVKQVLYRHNLKGRSERNKPLLQNRHKKARLQFATAHGDKDCIFWRNVLWSEETN